ncbi:MAG: glycosyltransferase family 87 protein [Ginsengibacter sp.]
MNLLTKNFRVYKLYISFTAIIWFLLAIISVVLKIKLGHDKIGNYLIFENVFWNTVHQTNLYFVNPASNLGSYLYGPLFSIVIAPFAIFSINMGAFFWGLANAAFLFFAIRKLPVSYKNQNIILLFSAVEMMTSVQNMQINCLIAGLIIFAFIFVQKEKDFWATLFIAIGFLVKIYGIVGITFILFSRHKLKFTLSFGFWLIVLFCLPMLISSPSFILHSYSEWYYTLISKDTANTFSDMQNISVMGMVRHIFKMKNLNLFIALPAAVFYALPFLRTSQLKNLEFKLSYLALALIGVVIFSSSAESPTYIIAVTGVGIWYIVQDQKQWPVILLLITTFLLTSLSSTDFFSQFIKLNYVRPYALKALPCFIVWVVLVYQLLRKDFSVVKNV